MLFFYEENQHSILMSANFCAIILFRKCLGIIGCVYDVILELFREKVSSENLELFPIKPAKNQQKRGCVYAKKRFFIYS